MDISSENGGISSDKLIDYFTKYFLLDLQKMVATKEELAKRQGAMSAVEQTLALKQAAEKALADARAQAEAMVADAKALDAKSKTVSSNAQAREKAVEAAEKAFEAASSAKQDELNAREKTLNDKEAYLLRVDAEVNARNDALTNAEAALATRVKAFQEKVANLSA